MTRRSPDVPRSVVDDGVRVVIDLHGCTVEAAIRIIRKTLVVAAQAGRSGVEVIHGMGSEASATSIRGALRTALLDGRWADIVTDHVEVGGGRTVISLPLAVQIPDSRRISLRDVTGR